MARRHPQGTRGRMVKTVSFYVYEKDKAMWQKFEKISKNRQRGFIYSRSKAIAEAIQHFVGENYNEPEYE